MKYSEIIGAGFYQIGLTPACLELVDAHYLAAAHHRQRCLEAPEHANWHSRMFASHVSALFSVIAGGNFSHAVDPLDQGFDDPTFWAAPPAGILLESDIFRIEACLPDPGMFHEFPADRRYPAGSPVPYDAVLSNPKAVASATLELLAA
jgi:hypothetical protein